MVHFLTEFEVCSVAMRKQPCSLSQQTTVGSMPDKDIESSSSLQTFVSNGPPVFSALCDFLSISPKRKGSLFGFSVIRRIKIFLSLKGSNLWIFWLCGFFEKFFRQFGHCLMFSLRIKAFFESPVAASDTLKYFCVQ